MSILFHNSIFGPLKSRRLGISLGVNLLPSNGKICTFNCIYCECGWNRNGKPTGTLADKAEVEQALEECLTSLRGTELEPDSITFSGNGEPTLHPQFPAIIDSTLRLRDRLCPKAKVSVLTNGTRVFEPTIFAALQKVDNNIIKLDGGTMHCIDALDQPNIQFDLKAYIDQLKRFNGNLIIQTLFLRGHHNGMVIDNTTDEEVRLWLEHLASIQPKRVMMYVIERETPEQDLEKIDKEELEHIAEKVRKLGIETDIYA